MDRRVLTQRRRKNVVPSLTVSNRSDPQAAWRQQKHPSPDRISFSLFLLAGTPGMLSAQDKGSIQEPTQRPRKALADSI